MVRFVKSVVAMTIVLVTPVTAAMVLLATNLFLPLPARLPEPEKREAILISTMVDAAGNEIGQFRQFELNIPINEGDIPDVLKKAVIAAEDKNFYTHGGVDARATLRALYADLRAREIEQGGSTITQQLVKNAYGVGKERSLSRKIEEAVVAAQLDRASDKDDILFQYLSFIYFGDGAYGIGAAAEVYFDKLPSQLDLSESALLAGVIPAPSRYSPRVDPAAANARRRHVLDQMLEERLITASAHRAEYPKELWFAENGPPPNPLASVVIAAPEKVTYTYPYFADYVRRFLIEELPGGEEQLYRGGLTIETTIDPTLQLVAQDAVNATLDGIPSRVETVTGPDGSPVEVENPMQLSLVAVDPRTGFVPAFIGGRDFERFQSNLALGKAGGGTGRQPGSSFKPFVLATAFDQGITPNAVYSGAPDVYPEKTFENYGGAVYGRMSLREATVKSVNTVFTRLIADVGVEETIEMANKLGLDVAPLNREVEGGGIPIALGAREVAPLNMASAFGVFATGGQRLPPTPVLRVTGPDGEVVLDYTDRQPEQVVKKTVADNVTDVLKGVLVSGTAAGRGIGRPAAGKTGTASDSKDAWFVGYTPALSTAVWMGYDIPAEMRGVKGRRVVTGGSFPAQTWQRFMAEAHNGIEPTDFDEPAPIEDITTAAQRRERRGFAPGRAGSIRGTEAGTFVEDAPPFSAPPPTAPPRATTTTTTTTTEPTTSTTSSTTTTPTGQGGIGLP